MRKRSKEENAVYSRAQRLKRRITVSPEIVSPLKSVSPVSPKVENVTDKQLAIIKRLTETNQRLQVRVDELLARIDELEDSGRAKTNHKEDKMDGEDLFKRVMREKEDRLR